MNALGGIPAAIDPTIQVAGKTIASTFVDMVTSPDLLASAAEEISSAKDLAPAGAVTPMGAQTSMNSRCDFLMPESMAAHQQLDAS